MGLLFNLNSAVEISEECLDGTPNRSLFLNARKFDGLEKKIDQGVLTKILEDFFRKP